MKVYLEKISQFIKTNPAYSIVIANTVLLVLLFLTKDPLSLRSNTYEKAKPFLDASASSITKILIEKTKLPDSKLEFNKQSDVWKFTTKGKEIPAETEKIDSLIKSFLNARKFTVVSSSKDKNDEYGFNEDEMRIEFFQGTNSVGYFLVGSSGKNGSSTHVKWKDSSDIYLIEENLKAGTGRGDANHFYNKRISPINLNAEEILSLDLSSGANSYKLKKLATWTLESPSQGEIANDDMNTTLTKLTSMNADDILLDDSILKSIDSFPYTITISYKDKENIPKNFSITSAGFDKKLNAYYIRKNTEPTIYKMSEYSLKSILEWKPATLVKK